MFDTDVHGTVLEAIAGDMRATATYLLDNRKDGTEEKGRTAKLHIRAAIDMLSDLLDDIEENASDYDDTPSVTVTYANGSSMRITGHFGKDTVADVARLIRYDSAEDIPADW